MKSLFLGLLLACLLSGKMAKLEGADVHYEAAGRGARTLVLVHGWTCDRTFWQGQTATLARQYRVLAVDLPGHGRSAAAPDYSMGRFARAVEAVMRAERVGRAVLAGHSMGGAVLLEFSRLFPARVEGLVLVDALMIPAGQAEKLSGFYKSFEGPGGPAARQKMVESMFVEATTPPLRDKILKTMLAAPEPVAVGAMRQSLLPEVWKEGSFAAPVLAVVANPAQVTEESIRVRFPNLTYRTIPGVGHFLMMEKPEEMNALILEWLKGLP
jgi:pimeloyl-ACP methyl ester carboxylesterase